MAKRCAIIGAGPAGCTAAYELQKSGFDVQIFEANAQVGGRTQTWREQNLNHDSGAGFFTNFYPNLESYIDELELHDEIITLSRNNGLVQNGKAAFLQLGSLQSFLKFPYASIRSKISMLRETLSMTLKHRHDHLYDCEKLAEYDEESVATYIRKRCNDEVYHAFIRPGIEPFWYFSCEEVSQSLLLALQSKAADAKFYTFAKGMDTFCRSVTKDMQVHTNTAIEDIAYQDNEFILQTKAESFRSDFLVIASTASVAARICKNLNNDILPEEQRRFLSEQRYTPNIHAAYLAAKDECPAQASSLCPSGPGQHQIAAIGFGSLKGQNSDESLQGKELVAVFLSGEQSQTLLDKSEAELYTTMWQEARKFYPALPKEVTPFKLIKRAEAIPNHSVGRYKKAKEFWQGQKAPLVFAGDYLSTATVDGAIWSGKKAAGKISEVL